MKRIYLFFIGILVVAPIGCLFDSDDSPPPSPESYTLHIEPLGIDTHPDGGGLILMSLDPEEDFTGNVYIRAYPPEHVRVVPQIVRLTRDRNFNEIEVYINSTAELGEMELVITSTHEGVSYTTPVPINIEYLPSSRITDGEMLGAGVGTFPDFVKQYFPEHGQIGRNPPCAFTSWIISDHPEYGIMADNTWTVWCERIDASNPIYRYVNSVWDIRVQWYYLSEPPQSWYSVRRRGNVEPFLYVKGVSRDINVMWDYLYVGDWEEISAEEFGVPE